MDVGYNDSTRTVTLSGNGYKVNMTLDKSEYTINDIPFEMDVPAQVVKDRTLIPLRVMAESIGKRVEWDADNRLIYIGSVQFYDKANAAKYAAALKDGKEEDQEIIETPVPTEEPDLLATADYTEYTPASLLCPVPGPLSKGSDGYSASPAEDSGPHGSEWYPFYV